MLLVLLLYSNLYSNNIYDFIIYFCFGLAISLMFNATLLLLKKFNIISSNKFTKKYGYWTQNALTYLQLSEESKLIIGGLLNLFQHILVLIIVILYSKKYITKAKKTNNPKIIAFILFIIYCLFNIYINDAVKIYNKSLALTRGESKALIISITITYSGLLYYFETIKNEKVKLIN